MIIPNFGGGGGGSDDRTLVTATVKAASWSNGEYSFEGTYPASKYDMEQVEPYGTKDQVQAFSKASCIGSPTANKLISYGTVPTVDIPVMFFLRRK